MYESYVLTGVSTVQLVVKLFGQIVIDNIRSPPAANGVDITREERYVTPHSALSHTHAPSLSLCGLLSPPVPLHSLDFARPAGAAAVGSRRGHCRYDRCMAVHHALRTVRKAIAPRVGEPGKIGSQLRALDKLLSAHD